MNKRIRELAEQSGAYFGAASQDYFGDVHPAFVSTDKIDLEKFAKLIVQDCTWIVTTTEIERNDNARLRGEIASKITKHFGVTE